MSHQDTRAEIDSLLGVVDGYCGRPLTFMEVCGTHTMAAARCGLRQRLPETVRLVSGPGCPVCVTPVGYVDHALALAAMKDTVVATFGDLMRVPGSDRGHADSLPSLARVRALGADVRVVYSPLDALELAVREPNRQVVFLGVGFETTAPTLAAVVLKAAAAAVRNFSILCAAKTIPGPMEALVTSGELGLDGFLCPGHVSVILGSGAYEPLAEKHHIPCAIAGFEPVELLRGLAALVRQVACGEARVDNCYRGAVTLHGNVRARALLERVFEPCDSDWRGIGPIPGSGLRLRDELAGFDAALRFPVELPPPEEPRGCRCGEVLRGVLDPAECGLFSKICNPEHPRGACMVSSEGACAARYMFFEGASR